MTAAPSSRATDPVVSAWVSANAGAGKTHLLADRVTRLLLAGANPSRILCLTYTKAAAAEMAVRLFNRLGEWALVPDEDLAARLAQTGVTVADGDLDRARRLFAQALETPGGLKIQTIHSFCQNVLGRFPLEAGIPARFSVLDERSAAELMRLARTRILERAARGDSALARAVDILAVRTADGRFAECLDLAIANGGTLRALLARHEGDVTRLFSGMRRSLGAEDGDDEASVLAAFCTELGGEKEHCLRVARWLLAGSSTDQRLGGYLATFIDSGMGPDDFVQLRGIFLTSNGEPRKTLATKQRAAADPGALAYLESLKDRVLAIEERRKAAATAVLTEALVTVAFAVLSEYDRLKKTRAVLDYDDLTVRTLTLLEGKDAAAWVLYKLDGGLDHILVDEAQDTSPEQWRIVGKLAEEFFSGEGARERAQPRTLFAVGDEKQSIFSFQGADPSEFGRNLALFRARAEGALLPFEDARPPLSRRSARAVLQFVDAVFAEGEIREGLTSVGAAIQHEPHRTDMGRVEIWPLVEAMKTSPREDWDRPVDEPARASAPMVLASWVAERIAGWLRDGVAVPGTGQPVRPGDIMILVRRRNAFAEEMIRQLVERNVPVAGADRMVLLDQIAIMDLVALGRFALLPDDDLTLAALLKSPLIGLSEEALFELAHDRQGTLWAALATRAAGRDFAQAHAFLSDVLAKADLAPPFEFYAQLLADGARQRLVARLGPEASDAIDEFLALALAYESAHPPSLEGFLAWFERGASDVKRDMEQAGGAVRVMTVHGAKGLEAGIVIVPDTAQIPNHEAQSHILYTDDFVYYGAGKAHAGAAVKQARAAAQRRELEEYRRLLYVALTRARDWLVICGYAAKNGVPAQSWYPALAAAAARLCHEEPDPVFGTIRAFGEPLTRAADAHQAAATRAPVLPDVFSRAAPREAMPRLLRPSMATDDAPVTPPGPDAVRRFKRGRLIHTLLATLPEVAPAEREAAALSYLARAGMDADEARLLLQETRAILDDDRFAPLFADASRAEIAVSADLGGGVHVGGQIDRLAITDDEVLIADYKTNRPPPESPDKTPLLYRAQMALYREALKKIYPGRQIRCALVWTDGARLMELPEALLDAERDKLLSPGADSEGAGP